MASKDKEKETQSHEPQIPAPQPEAAPEAGFERVIYEESNEPVRDPAGALVSTSGLTQTNSGGHIQFTELAQESGVDPADLALDYWVNTQAKQITFYAVDRHTLGAAPVRRYMDRLTTFLYLKPIFAKYPELRPKIRKQCSLQLTTDSKGRPCIILSLGTGLDRPVVTRKSDSK